MRPAEVWRCAAGYYQMAFSPNLICREVVEVAVRIPAEVSGTNA